MNEKPPEGVFGIIAGNGTYPFELVRGARQAGVARVVVAAFENETDPALAEEVDEIEWMRVGQLGRLLAFFEKRGVRDVVMAGQIAPKNLFDLRPDFKALLVLGRLKERNAESIFGAIGEELAKVGVTLLPATTYMESALAPKGHICGPTLTDRQQQDAQFGFSIAKEVSRLDIGQTVVVKNGTVLAVEAFEGTNVAIRRGGQLGRKDALVVKVSKPNQDLRFDVPVVGPQTLQTAAEAKVRVIAVEAGKTLLIGRDSLFALSKEHRISIVGL